MLFTYIADAQITVHIFDKTICYFVCQILSPAKMNMKIPQKDGFF